MKKLFIITIAIVTMFTFVSCASTKIAEEVKRPVVLGKDGIPRPDWVINDISTQDVHYAVGYGKLSNFTNSQKRALVEGRNLIAEWVSTAVDEVIVNYTNDAGENANRQAMDAFEAISKQQASAWLSGSKQESIWEDAEGGVYVLVSIPVANVQSQMIQLAEGVNKQAFEKNEAAEVANEMMDDAIAKYFGK
jgi:hypothetical protein